VRNANNDEVQSECWESGGGEIASNSLGRKNKEGKNKRAQTERETAQGERV